MAIFDNSGSQASQHNSSVLPRKAPFKKGDFIGQKYEVFDVLGEGGFGIVYLVYSDETKEVYALKTFRDEYLEDTKIRERFKREAQVWIDLERHPYLVRAYLVNEISGRLYIAMEHIASDEPGMNTLDGFLRRRPPDIAQSLRWAIQFCYGMEYACSKGVKAHRDIKPANIMIDQNKTVKIADFGLAGVLLESSISEQRNVAGKVGNDSSMQTAIGTSIGTPEYMPPEQFTDLTVCDERSDIYSFGIVLYQMASGGKLPFYTDNPDLRWTALKHFHQEAPVPKLNSPLFPVIQRCLEKAPEKRYQAFKDLRTDLEVVLKKQTGEVVTLPKSEGMDSWEWNNKGVSLNNLSKYQEAINCYDKAIKLDPMNAGAWSNKGIVLHQIDKFQEAIDCSERALRINPSHAGAWLNKGGALISLCRYQEAIDCCEKALKINPSLAEAWGNKAVCFEKHLGNFPEAQRCYDKALKIDPSSETLWLNKGVLFSQEGKLTEALQCFDRVLDINPLNLPALYNKGGRLMELNRVAEAKPIFEKLIELDPNDRDGLFNLGLCYFQFEDIDNALSIFQKADRLDENDSGVWYWLMNIYFKKQDADNTLKYCDKLIEAHKYFEEAVKKKSLLLFYTGRKQEAIRLMKDVLANNDNCDLLWLTLSSLYEQSHDFIEALNAANKCLQILNMSKAKDIKKIAYVSDVIHGLNGKQVNAKIPQLEQAIQELKIAEIEHNKQKPHADAIRRLVQLYLNDGDKQKALYYCDMLIETTNYITDFGNKALVMSFFGDYAGAAALLTDILKEWPHVDSLWYVLSNIHEQHKNYSEALKAAMKCRDILLRIQNPNRQNLVDIEQKIQILQRHLKNEP